jgi:hypothetical protein
MFSFVRRHLIEHFSRSGEALAQIVRKGHINAGILFFRRDRQGKNFALSQSRKRFHWSDPVLWNWTQHISTYMGRISREIVPKFAVHQSDC